VSIYVLEHKTSSEDIGVGSIYWQKLTLDAQISNYMIGARALGHEPRGVLYDVLRKPALRPYEANSKRPAPETPEAYRDRILADIAERPDYYYQRGLVVRLDEEERDAAFDTWQTAEQIRLSRNSGRWPRNVDACSMYNRLCDYWPVCSGEVAISDMRYEQTETHPELDGKHHLPLLTSSSARTYRSCARKYQFAYDLGIRPRVAASALSFGKRIHAGLETWLTSGLDVDAALSAMKLAPYDNDCAKAEAMVRGYDARWRNEPFDVVEVEKEFTAPLVNPETGGTSRTFLRAGRIDALVRRQDV
jgi:hypothetical protein